MPTNNPPDKSTNLATSSNDLLSMTPPLLPVQPPLASPDVDTSCCLANNYNDGNVNNRNLNSTLNLSEASADMQPGSVSVSPIVCRICYSTKGQLYAFCKCKGSVGYVHKDCLKRWIDAKLKANNCEICQAPFSGTDWSFKPVNKWRTPKMGVLDKLYLALFVCCSVIVLYSIPWISFKVWRSREVIFGEGPITPERVFALIVIAIYIPLNIACIVSLVVLWQRAVSSVFHRFLDSNKMWRVKITREVSKTRLINAVNSSTKSTIGDDLDDIELISDSDPLSMTPLRKMQASPRRVGGGKRNLKKQKILATIADPSLGISQASADSSAMLLSSLSFSEEEASRPCRIKTDSSATLRSFTPTDV